MIYFGLYGILFYFSLLAVLLYNARVQTQQVDTVIIITFSIFLFFLAAFRNNTGVDFFSYARIFTEIKNAQENLIHCLKQSNIEPGYWLVNIIAPTFRWVLIIVSLITVVSKCYFIIKRGDGRNKLAFLFFYYCSIFIFYDMGIMRQGIAIGIVFLSLESIEKRRKIRFLFYIIAAMSFHLTAILAVPLYFFSNRERTRKFYYISMVCCILLSYFCNIKEIFQSFVDIMNNPYISHKVYVYLNERVSGQIPFLSILKRILFLIFFIEIFKRPNIVFGKYQLPVRERGSRIWLYVNGYFLSLIEMVLFSFLPIVGTRGSSYLYFLQIMLFTEIISDKKLKRLNYLYLIIFSVLMFFTMRNTIFNTIGGNYLPYKMGIS